MLIVVFYFQFELLQRQVTDLADSHSVAEDRTTRTKTEYAVLQTRYHMLEEQYRDVSIHTISFFDCINFENNLIKTVGASS